MIDKTSADRSIFARSHSRIRFSISGFCSTAATNNFPCRISGKRIHPPPQGTNNKTAPNPTAAVVFPMTAKR